MIIKKQTLFTVGKVMVAIVLIYFLFKGINGNEIISTFRQADPTSIILGSLIICASILIFQSLKLHILLNNEIRCKFSFSLRMIMISLFYNNLLPSSVGGDLVKMFYIKQEKTFSWNKLIIFVSLEKLTGILALLSMGAIYFAIKPEIISQIKFNNNWANTNNPYVYIVSAILLICLIVLFLKYQKKLISFVNNRIVIPFREIAVWRVLFIIGISVLFHLSRMVVIYFLVESFGQTIDLFNIVFVIVATALMSSLPISIGAIGVRENTLAYSLAIFGISNISGVSVALFYRLLFVFYGEACIF